MTHRKRGVNVNGREEGRGEEEGEEEEKELVVLRSMKWQAEGGGKSHEIMKEKGELLV